MLPCARGVLLNLCKSRFAGTSATRSYWRRNVFSELQPAMQAMENRMREMDREMNQLFDNFQKFSPVKLPRIFSSLDESRSREVPVVSIDDDGQNYRLQLDMKGIEPEDINVTVKKRELTITASKDEKSSNGSRFVHEAQYHYTLPKGVNPDTIRSSLAQGVLTIEAPLPALGSKEIKVSIESGQSDAESKSDETKTL